MADKWKETAAKLKELQAKAKAKANKVSFEDRIKAIIEKNSNAKS